MYPPAQPLCRIGYMDWKQEDGQPSCESHQLFVRPRLSNSLHKMIDGSFWRRSENHSIIVQRRLFSHSHHPLAFRLIARPCHSISMVFETGGEAHRKKSIPCIISVFEEKRDNPCIFHLLVLERGGEDSGLHNVFEQIFQQERKPRKRHAPLVARMEV